MAEHELTTNIAIQVDGTLLSAEVKSAVLEVSVDQHVHLPDMFTIRLVDVDLKLLDEGPFDLTKEVIIKADSTEEAAQGEDHALFKGEVTALEPNFNDDMNAELVVRGYDKTHRLFRETKSIAHVNKKDSDLAETIAGNAGLSTEVESTPTVYDHIFQHNQSDLAFLSHRAWRIGYECFVEDGKLYFRKPPTGGEAVTLRWGDDLRTFLPRMTLAEQVDEVQVRGWDFPQQEAIVGLASASAAKLYPKISESRNGAQHASSFGNGKLIVVDQPVVSQAEANILAQARLNEMSGTFVKAEGTAFRRPDIRAGKWVELEALGERLSGKYLVTQATHYFTAEGLETRFSVQGARLGTLAEQVSNSAERHRWTGVVLAKVTNADDPENYGSVKVKYPWLTDDGESYWARVASAGAGQDAGFYAIPEVDDEVLVAFEHGDFDRPIVIGSLWNGQAAIPDKAGSGGEQPQTRIWRSRSGHTIRLHDNADNKIEIETAGGHILTISDADKKITLKSSGGNEVVIDDNGNKMSVKCNGDVKVEAQMNVEITATANMTLKATGNMDIQANGQVNIKGTMVNLN